MTTIRLGAAAADLEVLLHAGRPFACELRRKDATGTPVDWGAAPTVAFPGADGGPVTWTATLAGPVATITGTANDVDLVLAGDGRAELTLGTALWASGWVVT